MKLERKLFVVGCCVMLVSLGLSALATRTITDSNDTIYSGIICSNGNTYTATAANLQTAIYSIGNNSGHIDVYSNRILVSSTIKCTKYLNIDFHDTWLYSTTDINIIEPRPENNIYNLNINVSQVASFTHSCIYINGSRDYYSFRVNRTSFSNINLYGGVQDGYGIQLAVPSGGASSGIGFCFFDKIKIKGFYIGIFLNNDATHADGGGYINSNSFTNINGAGCDYFIFLDNQEGVGSTTASESATSGNIFSKVIYQPYTNTDTFFASVEGWKNVFEDIIIWDWTSYGDSTQFIRLNATGNYTSILNYFASTSPSYPDPGKYIIDNSFYSSYSTGNSISMKGSSAAGINVSHINKYENNALGTKFFASSRICPYIYLYGYASAVGTPASKYAAFRSDTKGSLEITTQVSGIDLEPFSGKVNLTSVLHLSPATLPSVAIEGDMYYDSGFHKLRVRTNTAWVNVSVT